MSKKYGTGVGRHLNGKDRQFSSVVFQPGKAPISEEFNLLTDAMGEARRLMLAQNIPSGWVMNVENPMSDYEFNPLASNLFWLGRSHVENANNLPTAIVNGWVVPVAGTLSSDLRNAIKLPPPLSSTTSTDVNFVFLEVWQAQLSPDGSVNKPADDQIFRFGNVEFGAGNLSSQILDARYNIETSERHQLQYRIRVVNSVNPEAFPYGFNPAIRAQGPGSSEVVSTNTAYQFENMGEELGDPGLWRSGVAHSISEDGLNVLTSSALDTVDGYVYAVPIALVFRRSSESWDIGQQASGVNRNPDMSNRAEAAMLSEIVLTQEVGPSEDTLEVSVSQASTTFPTNNGQIRIGRELVSYTSWVGTTITIGERGFKDSQASRHEVGTALTHVTGHPLNLYSDQITSSDVYDLRHAVNLSGFDYDSMLRQNFMSLCQGTLTTQWKVSSGNVKGTRHFQADYFSQQAAPANYAVERDGPDGFRKVFSDACVLQGGNLLVAQDSTSSSSQYSFNPTSSIYHPNGSWESGDSFRLDLDSLRDSFKTADNQKVRFVHPNEYANVPHNPVSVRFGDRTLEVGVDTGLNAERGLIVLGSTPNDVSSLYHTGMGSTLDFEVDSIKFATGGGAVIDFSSTAPNSLTMANYLASLGAYVAVESQTGALPYKGAFPILGDDGGNGLAVGSPDGTAQNFGALASETCDWRIRLPQCTEEDGDLLVVLAPGTYADTVAYLTFDVLYHPGQGLGRVPEVPLYTRLEPGGSTAYVRENGFANVASSTVKTVKAYPTAPMESFPNDPTKPRFKGQDATTSIEDTWAESYVDKGSKTLWFQPLREAFFTTVPDSVVGVEDGVASYTGLGSNTGLDFALADGDPCVLIPSEVLPKIGRQDLPFVKDTTGSVPAGINFLFPTLQGGVRVNENLTQNRVLGIYDPQNTSLPADYETFTSLSTISSGGPSESALVCRLYDRGGVRGLELPAHFGVARLFGVYDRADYYTNGSEFTVGSNYRVRKTTYSGQNLLRRDVTRRSIILTENNTFVIPEDVLDLDQLSGDLSTQELVFEFGAFMFSDWKADAVVFHTVEGTTTVAGPTPLLLNGPAAAVDTFFQVSTRIPYQGNLNGTMPVSTTDVASTSFQDYTVKSQADRASNLDQAAVSLDARAARVQNPAKLEILAHVPFMTSVGTGRVSGKVLPGTLTDVGYVSQKGFPYNLDKEVREAKTSALEGEYGNLMSDVLAGMSERLPAGLLSSDHLHLGEGFLDGHLKMSLDVPMNGEGFYSDYQNNIQLTKAMGHGTVLFSDGTSGGNSSGVSYQASGDLYRTYRGGVCASANMPNPGGSILMGTQNLVKNFPELRSFATQYAYLIEQNRQSVITQNELTEAINKLIDQQQKLYQIHGAVTFGVAFLVRTQKEVVTSNELVFNHGGELQMLVMTGTAFGKEADLDPLFGDNPARESIKPVIQLQPSGLGEGYSAADRYRLPGRPLRLESKQDSSVDFEIDRGSKPSETPDPICP
jgi:hypothetical protein